jgi:spore germination cell wall hydrolase CwlJ-like protein
MNRITEISLFLFLLLSVATIGAITVVVPNLVDTNKYVAPELSEEKLESNIEPEVDLEVNFDIEEARCLAENVYHEARNQGTAGWLAVAAVTMNRVIDNRFPNTICEVVFQAETKESWKTKGKKDILASERIFNPIRHRCQFSWYCDGKSDDINNVSVYMEIMSFSRLLLTSETVMFDITDGATFYHADSITPSWAKSKIKTIEIGDHIFYRWK